MFTTIEIIGMIAFAVVLVALAIGFQVFDHVSTKARIEAREEAEQAKRARQTAR